MTNPNSLFVLVYTEGHYKNQCATLNDLNLPGEPGVAFFSDRSSAHTAMGAREDFHAMTLGAFFALSAGMATDIMSNRKRAEFLESTIETFLEEGVEGALYPDDFIHDHKVLAEAIGFEFTEEVTFTVGLEVSAKVKRGTTVSLSDLSIALESDTDDIEILDVDVAEIHQY
jgi:hypothetical protein